MFEKIYNKKIILDLSRKYSISPAFIGQVSEFLLFKRIFHSKLNNNEISSANSIEDQIIEEREEYIKQSKMPQEWFSIRLKSKENRDLLQISSDDIISEIIHNLHQKEFELKKDPSIPNVIYFHVDGPFNLSEVKKQITIDRFAAESVMTGANLYVPGFNKIAYDFKKSDFLSIHGPNNIHVANGVAQIDSSDLNNIRKGLGVDTIESLYKLPSYRDSEVYNNGLISDQTLSSLVACWALMSHYHGTEQILDMCSAPGHKTCALSEIGYYLTNGKFPKIISVDRSEKRLQSLFTDLERLQLENIKVIISKIQKLKESHPELLLANDLVILDPPCTAMGTRPKLIVETSWKEYRSLFLLQRSFLKIIDEFIKPGGILLYTTCTLTLLENEGIVSYAMDRLGYELISVWDSLENIFPDRFRKPDDRNFSRISNKNGKNRDIFGNELHYGIPLDPDFLVELKKSNDNIDSNMQLENLEDLEKYVTLSAEDAKKMVRFYPDSPNTTGYFVSLLRKREN